MKKQYPWTVHERMGGYIRGRNGKWYVENHPRELKRPSILSFDEIRFWLIELATNPDYGWVGHRRALEYSLGFDFAGAIDYKTTTGWIYPAEQMRLTHRIRDIRQGYIVCKQVGKRWYGVWTDPPQPPKLREMENQRVVKMQARPGKRLSFVVDEPKPAVTMPDFVSAMRMARHWHVRENGAGDETGPSVTRGESRTES